MNKVLIITYYWPPSGGAGVQRWLRFAKYLPKLGWEPVILTIDPEYATYPALDNSLLNEVPDALEVHRTKATDWFRIYTRDKSKIPSSGFARSESNSLKDKLSRFIRGNFFIPDPRRGWNKFAFKKACELIESTGITRIITTSPPHSTQLIGLKLKKKYPAIKWIADLRDPWTDIYYYDQFYPTFLSKKIDAYYEHKVLERADRIITVGPSLKTLFESKLEGISDKTDILTNGYDEDDFIGITPKNISRFTITYVGTLSEKYPIGGFLKALTILVKNGRDFLFRFAGTVPEKIKQKISLVIPKASLEFIPYLPHNEAIKKMTDSSLLLLIIPENPNNNNITTGKIFEYIASGKPVICIGPKDGDAAMILSESKCGQTFADSDHSGILSYLEESFLNWQSGGGSSITERNIKPYSRENITIKLARIIQS